MLLKGRHEFTDRWLCIHDKLNLKIPIHIADGSISDSNRKIILDFQSKNKNLDIDYKYYGKDVTLEAFYLKTSLALENVKTEYVMFTCNDDFLIENSIREGERFLNSNPSYVAAAGPVYDTAISQINISHNHVWGALSHPVNQYPAFNRFEDDPEKRIYHFLAGRKNSYIEMALHRKKVMQEIFSTICRVSPPDLRFQGQFISLLSLCHGKVSGAMQCMTLHQSNTMDSEGAKMMNNIGTWYKWLQSNEWFECYTKMVSEIVNLIAPLNKSKKKELSIRIEVYYQAFIGKMGIRDFHPTYKEELFAEGKPISKSSNVYNAYLIINKICNRDQISKPSNIRKLLTLFKEVLSKF